mmetsp:Transcript_13817/g.34529  ORF Transcript_13817/g.34529 Transcript_13817/m.34529 type:complete len:321 (+) Transcript_13817:534-1496(+)
MSKLADFEPSDASFLERVIGAASILVNEETSPVEALSSAFRRGERSSRASRASGDRHVEAAVSLSGLAAEPSSVWFAPAPVHPAPPAPNFRAPAPAPAPPPPPPPPPAPSTAAPPYAPVVSAAPVSVVDAGILARRARLANLPRPHWYSIPASASPNQSTDSLSPVLWTTVVDEALGVPLSPSSSSAICSVNADSLLLRLQGEFVVNRSLFVTDLGRLVVWHTLHNNPASATRAALSIALAAVRKSGLLEGASSVLARAEHRGDDEGMAAFLDYVDRKLLGAAATRTNSLWEGVKWNNLGFSAAALLDHDVNMGCSPLGL